LKVFNAVDAMRQAAEAARCDGYRVGLVPTMGALHAGHLSLLETARARADIVVMSLFVNPAQFGAEEDFASYPRDRESDLAKAEAAAVDWVFEPASEAIYPKGFASSIDVGPVAAAMEGAARPDHFGGVATVVAKLLNIVRPHFTVFGRKDGQQCAVIRRLIADLDLNVELVIGPTVREADGLALSSRNAYLKGNRRAAASALYDSLAWGSAQILSGAWTAETLTEAVRTRLGVWPDLEVEYVKVSDPLTMAPVDGSIPLGARLFVAARVGGARLIDNVAIGHSRGVGQD
jgi:pantoate--beta-alanine ligase